MARWHFKAGQQVGGIFIQALEKSKEMLQNWMSTDLVPQLQNIATNLLSGLWNVFMVSKRCHYWFNHCHLLSIQ